MNGGTRSAAHPRLTATHLAHLQGPWLSIGDHTYGIPDIQDAPKANLTIGRYCSIADQCVLILANHRGDFVTTYPFRSLSFLWPEADFIQDDHVSKGHMNIGNDVWLGYRTTILPGVTIGDGAIIGAGSVVTKDVPPYGVAAGNPAKLIRYRFPKHMRESLQRIRWWDWDDEKVADHISDLLNGNVEAFLKAHDFDFRMQSFWSIFFTKRGFGPISIAIPNRHALT